MQKAGFLILWLIWPCSRERCLKICYAENGKNTNTAQIAPPPDQTAPSLIRVYTVCSDRPISTKTKYCLGSYSCIIEDGKFQK